MCLGVQVSEHRLEEHLLGFCILCYFQVSEHRLEEHLLVLFIYFYFLCLSTGLRNVCWAADICCVVAETLLLTLLLTLLHMTDTGAANICCVVAETLLLTLLQINRYPTCWVADIYCVVAGCVVDFTTYFTTYFTTDTGAANICCVVASNGGGLYYLLYYLLCYI